MEERVCEQLEADTRTAVIGVPLAVTFMHMQTNFFFKKKKLTVPHFIVQVSLEFVILLPPPAGGTFLFLKKGSLLAGLHQ